ncbi:hypothetical protein ACLB1M_23685 [Escherichia coli]
MALAMVQKVHVECRKRRELLEKSRRIQLLEEMLKLVRQQRLGKKCETLGGMQTLPVRRGCRYRRAYRTSDNCSRNPLKKTKKRPVHARYANPYRLIFHGKKITPAGR